MDPVAVLALCHEHAAAEAELDIDRVLATLVPDPIYEFHPAARSLSGWAAIEDFYRNQYRRFVACVTGFEMGGEWANGHGAIQDYVIEVRGSDGHPVRHRVLSMMPVDEVTAKIAGETLFCADEFARLLLGPLWEATKPLAP